jgi:alpha-glucosidase (family GH31 glycosyl hydrolase)
MFNPITEVFSQPENPTANLAWLYSARADSLFRLYAQLRMQLFPYIYSYAHRSRIEGKTMIGKIPGQLYEYMFGDEILVAPVYEKGATIQKVFLPDGKWVNYWTGEQVRGNTGHTVAAPINQIPLFIRQGAIIPMRQYASSVERGNNNTLMLHIYPGENGKFSLVEDDGTSNDYLRSLYATTALELENDPTTTHLKIHPVTGHYKGMSSFRNWTLYIHCNQSPEQIRLNGQTLKFRYDKAKKIAIAASYRRSVRQLQDFEIR